ncbi:hypothetical protein HC256_007711 [Beauveria bassiana]|nr:hypothetical protein HC256_007711 [Beauveria bassiana]
MCVAQQNKNDGSKQEGGGLDQDKMWDEKGIRNSKLANPSVKMFSHAATRTTTTLVSRRAFHATRARMSSPYHYPEGPYTNLPFNPHSKWFGIGYWGFMATGFLAPFGIAVYQTYKSDP